MHWAEELAKEIIKRSPLKEEYICAAGISPSGSIHIGNFRDVATSYFVVKSLRRMGKKAKLLFSWDEYDRMRKVPKNVEAIADDMEKYIGMPYIDVHNPFDDDAKNYAEHFEQEFGRSIAAFDIDLVYRHQAAMYRSGKYVDYIIIALQKRKEIFDILDSFRTQDAVEGERDAYYPVNIYCSECHKDTTKITALSDDCTEAEYACKCGHKSSFNFTKDFDCKLSWKIDWPMRWLYEGVDFEPGGKDHASPNGSYQTSRIISDKIFGYKAPLFQGYEFIGIKGVAGKMSGSSGLNLTPEALLKIYQPEVILWLYSKTEPLRAFDFCFDDGILRQYHEFDTQYANYLAGNADELATSIIENCIVGETANSVRERTISTVPMGLLVQLGSIVDFNEEMVEVLFQKISMSYSKEDIAKRLPLAKYWVEQCAPDMKNTLRTTRNWDVFETLDDDEKEDIANLQKYLSGEDYTLDELNKELYEIVKKHFDENPEKSILKKKQAKFFSNVYSLLIDKTAGPRLYLFLFAVKKSDYLPLLDFSEPKTDAEQLPSPAPMESPEIIEIKEPDPVAPFKPTVQFDIFDKIDLRVCKITKCSEIRKSQNCFKITLFDGIGERVIVSSIKGYYTPEELIGKKIVVFVNLESKRITGVTSEGMLLASTNNASGCKVLFVDDSVPEGTRLS
ncbi:lysine--tRNA ligase [Clostridia bacterium]|nr:lysine--tRNA ligase [Clostridia bacterium]